MTIDTLLNTLKILGGLLVLYELGRAFFYLYKDSREFSWNKIEQAGNTLFEKIAESQFEPDLIVGLGRGGTIAAGLLAARFGRVRNTSTR